MSEPPQEIVALVESWVTGQGGFQLLEAITRPPGRPIAQELGDIIDGLYDFIERNRHILALIAACAKEPPNGPPPADRSIPARHEDHTRIQEAATMTGNLR